MTKREEEEGQEDMLCCWPYKLRELIHKKQMENQILSWKVKESKLYGLIFWPRYKNSVMRMEIQVLLGCN